MSAHDFPIPANDDEPWVQVGFHFPQSVVTTVKRIALEEKTTVAAVFADSVSLYLARRGLPVPLCLRKVGRKKRGRPAIRKA